MYRRQHGGLLRPFGIRLPPRQGTKKFAEAAHQAVRRDNMLHASVTALLEALAAIEGQIARLDEQLKELARRSPVCWRLMSVPGVGPIVALAFMSRTSITHAPRPRARRRTASVNASTRPRSTSSIVFRSAKRYIVQSRTAGRSGRVDPRVQ